jgi:hypothetical protein
LKGVRVEEVKATKQIFQNLYAATPENVKIKLSPEVYTKRLLALRNHLNKLNDNELIKNSGKMAGYIIKNYPEHSIFGIHLEN